MDSVVVARDAETLLGKLLQAYKIRKTLLERRHLAIQNSLRNWKSGLPVALSPAEQNEMRYCLEKERRLLSALVVDERGLEYLISSTIKRVNKNHHAIARTFEQAPAYKELRRVGISAEDLAGFLFHTEEFLRSLERAAGKIIDRMAEEQRLLDRRGYAPELFFRLYRLELEAEGEIEKSLKKAYAQQEGLPEFNPVGMLMKHFRTSAFLGWAQSDEIGISQYLLTMVGLSCAEFVLSLFAYTKGIESVLREDEQAISRLLSMKGNKQHWWRK